MKQCTYCGKNYPDDATVCEIDGDGLQAIRSDKRIEVTPQCAKPRTPPPLPNTKPSKRSVFLPLGLVLIVIGIYIPARLNVIASGMEPGALRSLLFIFTDTLRLGFFAGLGCAAIGILRNRRLKRPS